MIHAFILEVVPQVNLLIPPVVKSQKPEAIKHLVVRPLECIIVTM